MIVVDRWSMIFIRDSCWNFIPKYYKLYFFDLNVKLIFLEKYNYLISLKYLIYMELEI